MLGQGNFRTEVITSDAPDFSDLGAKSALFDQKIWLEGQAAIINTRISKDQVQIIDEIERDSTLLGDLLKVYVGVVASGMKEFLSPEPLNKNYKKYLQGRDLSRFKISPRKLFINFDKERLHSNTDESVYLQDEKLLVRKTGNFLLACYDDNQFYTDQSIYNLYAPSGRKPPVKTLLCFLNSSVLNFYFRKKMITNPDVFPYIKGIHLKQLPIKQFSPKQAAAFDLMATIILFAKQHSEQSLANFFDDLVDACVMECYFRDHMAERDLLFLDELAPHLANYDAKASAEKQREFITNLHRTLNAPASKIRNRLLRLTADSPDLLAVIKAEGRT